MKLRTSGVADTEAARALAAADGFSARSTVFRSSFMHVAERGGVVIVIMLPSGAIHSTPHGTPPSFTTVSVSKKGVADPKMPFPTPPPTRVRQVEPKS